MNNRLDLVQSVIFLALIVHIIWAFMLVGWGSVQYVPAPSGLIDAFGTRYIAAGALAVASVLAAYELLTAREQPPWGIAVHLLPQQGLLILAAWGSIDAALDPSISAIRTGAYVIANQTPSLMLTVLHSLAVWRRVYQ